MNKNTFFRIIGANLLIFMFLTVNIMISYSQQKDTIRIKNKKIIIIDEEQNAANDEQKARLDSGKVNFERTIDSLKISIKVFEDKVEITTDSATRIDISKGIAEMEKQIAALEKGLESIEEEMADIETEIEIKVPKQEDNMDKDDFDFKWHDPKKFKGHWSGFAMGQNLFMSQDFNFNLPESADLLELNTTSSLQFDLNPIQYSIMMGSPNLGIVTGMGFTWHKFSFDNDVILERNGEGVIVPAVYEETHYSKNSLHATYLTVPLLLEFSIPLGEKNRPLHFGTGLIGGIKIGSKVKTIEDGQKLKVKGDYQLNPFKYSATLRIGYRGLTLFADYSISTLFEKNKGPELYPFTLGIQLISL